MGSDGASVMLGNKNGVAAHLRRLQPAVVAVHCYAHKLELAFKDAIKRVPLDTKVSTCLLQGLYYLYHNSALNRSNLKNSFHSLSMKVMLPTRIGGTRWIGHLLRALINFMAGYQAIKQHLEQVGSPTERVSNSTSGKAKGLMKLLLSTDVILYCHFMADIATILSRVSRVFQRRECCAADIHGIIEETSKLILVYSTKDGPYLSKAKAMLHLSEVLNTSRPKPGESFPAARKALIDGLLTSLSNRFEIETVIKAMEIANFKCWPLALQENKKEIEDFGDNQLDMIIGHYESILTQEAVDPIEAVLEWTALKSSLYESRPNDIKKLTWQQVHGIYYDRYQNILAIMDLILTVPGSSSECERGFRQMKSIKTTFRSALSEQSLSSQLIIKLHSPSIEDFDPMPAIRLWNSKTVFKRRPLFMDTAQRKTIEKAAMAVNKELTAAIPVLQHIEENTPDSEAETEPQADAIEQPHALEESKLHDSNSTDSGDEYSDDEDYGSERRVYRAMYREGLMDESLCNVNF